MSTTQRSESINAFFDGLVRTTLKEFVDQFDNALRKGGEAEMAADFHSFNCNIPCITHLPVEKQFQDLYTNSKFKEVQSKVMGVIYAHCILIKTEWAISTYEVNDQLQVEGSIKRVTYMSYFNEEECEAKCMCGLFHMRGIFCRHILVIFSVKDVHSVPSKYIMERYANLVKLCLKVATNACEDDDNSVDMTQKLKTMNSIYTKNNEQPIFTNTSTEVGDIEMGSSKKVLSPHIVRGKGRPPSMRREPASKLPNEVLSGALATDDVLNMSGIAGTTYEVMNMSGIARNHR
ncbi:protein FAR-RED IMPAIRED RESPONSE 1-like [Carya illinoinensis]|uniref:protein FAR-RED IMPAIRED RESPONSE 1-like n=1 Tax=Carya illinoinensis TaxID=32201 RepID=UPI001C722600|nr:protein FAR-RED IMPAIRED RESPONSE 1-like [Carya illinoinensis]